MPQWVEDCVKSLMDDPDFKPAEGQTKEESAWAVCQTRYKEVVKASTITLETVSEPAQFIVAQEEGGEVLRFRNAVLAVAETNKNLDTITEEGLTEVAESLPGRPIDWDHDLRQCVGVFTEARVVKVGGTWGVSVGGLIWADRFPEASDGIQEGRLHLSIEAKADKAECSVCGGVFGQLVDYCRHLLDKAGSGARRILHGLKAVGGAVTPHPAGTGTDFDLGSVYFVASHGDGGNAMEVITVMDDAEYVDIMAKKLEYQERKDLPDSAFALVKKDDDKKVRRFPIHDCAHARNALSRLPQAQDLSSEERGQIKRQAEAKLNSPECKRETTEGGQAMGTIEEVQAALDDMTKRFDEEHAARLEAEAGKEGLESTMAELSSRVEELTTRLNETTAQLATTVMAHRAKILVLSGAMTDEEVEQNKEVVSKMDDDTFNLLLAKSNAAPAKRETATGGFSPDGGDPNQKKLVL